MRIQLSDHFTYRKLLRFTLPSIVMMVFTSIYGVVDGLFVSNFVGKGPFTAVNLVMPVVMIFGGLGFMFGTGGSALVAKTLGQGRRDQANRYFTMIAIATVGTGIVISALGAAFMRPICRWLRADAEIIDDCVLYGRILMGFNTAYMLQNVFQSFLITAEKPKLGLLATIAAGVTNMVLDALFIAGFGWGVAGAAVATGLSQCVGGLFPLLYFLRPNNSLLRLRPVKLQLRPILQSCGNGASEVVSSVTSSIIGMVYNFQLLRFAGKDGVAAYGVLMYTEFIFVAVFIGYAIGSAPVIGYHYGAENTGELKSLLRKSVTLNLGSGIVMLGIAQALAT
ncbi:MAG: MATE family efflux transporter, partial [Oscillospiraceae bacterium]|nr:MATE family efflux transporter [Oscillospiraceae bacterium]